jgi:hypothetical protein
MKLGQLLDQIETLSDYDIVYAKRPWGPNSDAILLRLDEDLTKSMSDQGFEYFLEVSIAQELLESFGSKLRSAADRHNLIIHYAENDAHPDWIFDR